MKQKKYTQMQRIERLEKAVANLYMIIQAMLEKKDNK